MFKKKEEKETWERLKVKKKRYEILTKEVKKLLIDYDDDEIDVLQNLIPKLDKELYAKIMILMEEYELSMHNTRLALADYLESSTEEDED